jgi:hypothetical protein
MGSAVSTLVMVCSDEAFLANKGMADDVDCSLVMRVVSGLLSTGETPHCDSMCSSSSRGASSSTCPIDKVGGAGFKRCMSWERGLVG